MALQGQFRDPVPKAFGPTGPRQQGLWNRPSGRGQGQGRSQIHRACYWPSGPGPRPRPRPGPAFRPPPREVLNSTRPGFGSAVKNAWPCKASFEKPQPNHYHCDLPLAQAGRPGLPDKAKAKAEAKITGPVIGLPAMGPRPRPRPRPPRPGPPIQKLLIWLSKPKVGVPKTQNGLCNGCT